jgi:serine/threonine protein kinase
MSLIPIISDDSTSVSDCLLAACCTCALPTPSSSLSSHPSHLGIDDLSHSSPAPKRQRLLSPSPPSSKNAAPAADHHTTTTTTSTSDATMAAPPTAHLSSKDRQIVHPVSPPSSPFRFEAPFHFHSLPAPTTAAWQRRAVRSCCAHIQRHVRHVVHQTPFLRAPSQQRQQPHAKLCRHEIVTGRVVGKGGFSAVSLVQQIRLDPLVSSRLSREENETRHLLATTCVDPATQQPRYVIKHLQERLLSSSSSQPSSQQGGDPATVTSLPTSCPAASPRDDDSDSSAGNVGNNTSAFAAAAIDLILEGEYLRRLDHPNIVRLVGMPALKGSEALRDEGRYDGFFLLLERVDLTLEDAIQAELDDWQDQQRHPWQHPWRSCPRTAPLSAALDAKLEMGIQLASALAHLHSLGIVFRDLKPQNVGIVKGHRRNDHGVQEDRVVLLDFGLCRQLPCFDDVDADEAGEGRSHEETTARSRRPRRASSTIRGVYHMSAVGTRRYLAVEVVNSSRYNELADVYSWSLVMWEYLALARPFPSYDVAQHALHVCQQGERPDVRMLPGEIRHLLGQCWTEDLGARLAMDEVVGLLTAIVRSHYYDRQRVIHNRGIFLIDAAMDEEADEDEGDAREDSGGLPIVDLALDGDFDEDMSISISSLRHARPVVASCTSPSELHLEHHAVSPVSWMVLPDESQQKAHVGTWKYLDSGGSASVTTRSMSSGADANDDDLHLTVNDGPEYRNFLDDSLAFSRDGMLVVTAKKRHRGSHPAAEGSSPPSDGTHLTALSCSSSSHMFEDLTSRDDHHHHNELSMSRVADPRVLSSSPFDADGTW